MRVAVTDIGSNSSRLLIADLQGDHVVGELERRSVVTRLGAGVDANGKLQKDAMQRVFAALDEFDDAIERTKPDKKVAVLTSAVRDATNGPEFAEMVRGRYGFEPHVLKGD